MTCPYCDFQGPWRRLHAHLAAQHAEMVVLENEEDGGRMAYRVTCPICGLGYQHPVKPRGDQSFLEEYRKEICLVAFDMLLAHLAGEHGALAEEVPGGGSPAVPHS